LCDLWVWPTRRAGATVTAMICCRPSRRDVVRWSAVVASASLVPVLDGAPARAADNVRPVNLELVTVTETTAVITWYTGVPGTDDGLGRMKPAPSDAVVVYGTHPSRLTRTAHGPSGTPYHYVELTDLEPGQTYYYKALSRGRAATPTFLAFGESAGSPHGDVFAFTTPQPPPGRHLFSVALCNDLHLGEDRKSTRLNSSHVKISYAVFCLKKKIHTNRLSATYSLSHAYRRALAASPTRRSSDLGPLKGPGGHSHVSRVRRVGGQSSRRRVRLHDPAAAAGPAPLLRRVVQRPAPGRNGRRTDRPAPLDQGHQPGARSPALPRGPGEGVGRRRAGPRRAVPSRGRRHHQRSGPRRPGERQRRPRRVRHAGQRLPGGQGQPRPGALRRALRVLQPPRTPGERLLPGRVLSGVVRRRDLLHPQPQRPARHRPGHLRQARRRRRRGRPVSRPAGLVRGRAEEGPRPPHRGLRPPPPVRGERPTRHNRDPLHGRGPIPADPRGLQQDTGRLPPPRGPYPPQPTLGVPPGAAGRPAGSGRGEGVSGRLHPSPRPHRRLRVELLQDPK